MSRSTSQDKRTIPLWSSLEGNVIFTDGRFLIPRAAAGLAKFIRVVDGAGGDIVVKGIDGQISKLGNIALGETRQFLFNEILETGTTWQGDLVVTTVGAAEMRWTD